MVNELDFGLDYAETLRRWRESFLGQEQRVRRLGFSISIVSTIVFGGHYLHGLSLELAPEIRTLR